MIVYLRPKNIQDIKIAKHTYFNKHIKSLDYQLLNHKKSHFSRQGVTKQNTRCEHFCTQRVIFNKRYIRNKINDLPFSLVLVMVSIHKFNKSIYIFPK